MLSRLAMALVFVLAGSASRAAHAQSSTAPRSRRHALAGCWRVDATRTLTLDGTDGRIETIDLVGFAASPVHSTLTWRASDRLYVVDTPGATGFDILTVSIDRGGTPSLARWERDHRRYMTRTWQQVHHAVHPLRISSQWALTRCAAP